MATHDDLGDMNINNLIILPNGNCLCPDDIIGTIINLPKPTMVGPRIPVYGDIEQPSKFADSGIHNLNTTVQFNNNEIMVIVNYINNNITTNDTNGRNWYWFKNVGGIQDNIYLNTSSPNYDMATHYITDQDRNIFPNNGNLIYFVPDPAPAPAAPAPAPLGGQASP